MIVKKKSTFNVEINIRTDSQTLWMNEHIIKWYNDIKCNYKYNYKDINNIIYFNENCIIYYLYYWPLIGTGNYSGKTSQTQYIQATQ